MIKIGMMIGDRYEILEKIGTGGMSDVYKAKCHKLNRYVAVKVLKQEFGENANFVSKFRIEAQAAAGLMHPNIVNVYDVGEENGIHYIVMELVEGITLKKYIEKKARLSYKEAVSIAIQVCMGIEAAHNNHIIHRDIKPQNIIISKDGKVKVTDFGIAKAATSNTITSNVMGSVHYTSPEQARGGYSDEKSDVYSLGITLFEMLTGRVPFNGETTVAIAIKHIQEELPSPQEFVGEIPNCVADIVLKCCQKSADRRYQNMPELIGDLKQSLMTPHADFVVNRDVEAEGGTRMVTEGEMGEIKRKAVVNHREDNQLRLSRTGKLAHPTYQEPEEEDEDYDDREPRMEKITTILAVVAGIIICIIIFVLLSKIFGLFSSNNPGNKIEHNVESTEQTGPIIDADASKEKITMISVAGWTLEDAKNKLIGLELVPRVNYEESDKYEADIVIRADVTEGAKILPGTTVHLTVSSGKEGIEVPSAIGYTYEKAYSLFADAGFKITRLEDYSSDVEKGKVINQFPEAGETVPKGSSVTVTVSIGPAVNKVKMPNVIGEDEMTATAIIVEAGLTVNSVAENYHDTVAEGLVYYQNHAQGTLLDEGTGVDIMISKGKATTTYKCNAVIEAPSSSEAPDYTSGSSVRITLITDGGKVLLDTTTTNFPQSANYYGISSSGGTVTIYYTVTTESTTVTDPETGATTTIPGTTEEKSFTRRLEFVKE